MAATASPLTTLQATLLVLLRFSIGWHFLHEGMTKLANPIWSSQGYLSAAHGPLGEFFSWMASSPTMLAVADFCTQWGLVLAGGSLLLGLFVPVGCLIGAALLALFYAANPAWGGMYSFGAMAPGAEGTYLLINKNVIEMLAVLALAAFPTGRIVGLDAVVMPLFERFWSRGKAVAPGTAAINSMG